MPYETIARRFWQFICFIQEHDLTTRIIASSQADIGPETELRNSDLTDRGYRFAQRYSDRWSGRVHKDKGEVAEGKLLVKWLNQLNDESVGA